MKSHVLMFYLMSFALCLRSFCIMKGFPSITLLSLSPFFLGTQPDLGLGREAGGGGPGRRLRIQGRSLALWSLGFLSGDPSRPRAGPGESGRSHTDGPVLLFPGSPLSDPGGGGARCGLLSLVPRLWDSRQADAPRSAAPASTWGRALAECRGGQS